MGNTKITSMKKKTSSVPVNSLIKLCRIIEINPPTTTIQSFLQLNKNNFLIFTVLIINFYLNKDIIILNYSII